MFFALARGLTLPASIPVTKKFLKVVDNNESLIPSLVYT